MESRGDADLDRSLPDSIVEGADRPQPIRQAVVTRQRVDEEQSLLSQAESLTADPGDGAEPGATLAATETLRAW
jgi:hypothetical protein